MIGTADFLNASILIVDDQAANVYLLEQMLQDAGYLFVTSTTDPCSVRALHIENQYDLILLDLLMPDMDGFQVMESLRKIETEVRVPILVISAQTNSNLRALDSGANDFISKPFDLREAKTRIHNLLEVRLLYKKLEHYSHELELLALHDTLTGLPNRRLLMERLSLAISHVRRNNISMAVMYLDLDGFKQINDTMGHEAGDSLLNMVAARLVDAVRQEDTVARLGGDEFVIVLGDLNNAKDINTLALKLIDTIALPYHIQSRDISITVSIGISFYPQHGEDPDALMKSADIAMYEAKKSGKNCYFISENNK